MSKLAILCRSCGLMYCTHCRLRPAGAEALRAALPALAPPAASGPASWPITCIACTAPHTLSAPVCGAAVVTVDGAWGDAVNCIAMHALAGCMMAHCIACMLNTCVPQTVSVQCSTCCLSSFYEQSLLYVQWMMCSDSFDDLVQVSIDPEMS